MTPTSQSRGVRRNVDDAVAAAIQEYDTNQLLPYREYNRIRKEIADDVVNRSLEEAEDTSTGHDRPAPRELELNDDDRAFVTTAVAQRVQESLDAPAKPPRFAKFERVVCNIGGEYGWAPGAIQALMEEDPEDATGPKLPYVVKIDPPVGRMISGRVVHLFVCLLFA
jgi:hypothetical protein